MIENLDINKPESPLAFIKTAKRKINEVINYIFLRQTGIVLADASTITWNVKENYNASVTLGGNRTLSVIGMSNGDYGTIKIIQDNVGSRTITLPSNSIVMGTQGSSTLTLSSTANYIDIATFYYDGINLFWTISLY